MEEYETPQIVRRSTPTDNQIAKYERKLHQAITGWTPDGIQALVDEIIAWAKTLSPKRQYKLYQGMASTLLSHSKYELAEEFLTAQLQLLFVVGEMRAIIFVELAYVKEMQGVSPCSPHAFMVEARSLVGRREADEMLARLKRRYR